DNVEATIEAIEIAMAFRKEFDKDVVIDLVGYRRYGHNEMDEPSITNPVPYQQIRDHDPVDILYGNQLVEEGIISKDQMNNIFDEVQKTVRAAHDKIDKNDKMDNPDMQKPESLQQPLQGDDRQFTFEQ
ncbi:2-oxoglutarate dehydrogenase E1 component, partial [Staphylococcus cohnii]|uniref:thiamine pyrophosphate-dependent enzyme n=1 Tax=Staphylococcus cohnii TaxID=29382 RepID=UPI000D4EFEAB